MKPPLWRQVLARWPADQLEEYEERCALVEHGCNVTREESEKLAFEIVAARWLQSTKVDT